MQLAKSVLLVPSFVLMCAASALSQVTSVAPTTPRQHGYLAAFAGAESAGTEFLPPTEPVFSLEYGDDIHRDVQAYATFSYFENLMSRSMRDDLAATAAILTSLTGTPWEFQGRDRGLALVAGAKYLVPVSKAVRPYVGGGAGAFSLKRTIREPQLGDVTAAVLGDFGLGDVALVKTGVTRPMVEGGFGVEILAGPTYIDVGYRYRRAFRLSEQFDLSQLSVGIGYRF